MNKYRDNDEEQLTGCFKYGKSDHIGKNFPLLNEEQDQEWFQKQGSKQVGNGTANRTDRCFSRAMLAAWGDSTEEDEGTKEEDAAVALMAWSESNLEDEPLESSRKRLVVLAKQILVNYFSL